MNTDLLKMIDSVIAGNDDDSKTAFSSYINKKTSSLIEATQQQMFGDTDDKSEKTEKRYLVTPMGVSYDELDEAKSVANNNYAKKAKVTDTTTDKCVHTGKKVA